MDSKMVTAMFDWSSYDIIGGYKPSDDIEIREVKYTNHKTYMYQGLEELLEYIYLIKDRDYNYIENIDIEGILFVDNIKLDKYDFGDIKIINRNSFKIS